VLKFYHSIYLGLLSFFNIKKDNFNKSILVVFILSFFQGLNIATLIIYINALYKLHLVLKLISLIVFIILVIFNYLIFLHKDRYRFFFRLLNDPESDIHKKQKRIKIIIISYFVISVLLFIYVEIFDAVNGNFNQIWYYLNKYFNIK